MIVPKIRTVPYRKNIDGRIVWVKGHVRDVPDNTLRMNFGKERKSRPKTGANPSVDSVYAAIRWYWKEYGLGPTVRQLEQHLSTNNRSTLVAALNTLEEQGLIERPFGKNSSRGITLPEIQTAAKNILE